VGDKESCPVSLLLFVRRFDETKIWNLPAENICSAAASRLVSQEQVSQILNTGLKFISPEKR
jgi:hypothetical protein